MTEIMTSAGKWVGAEITVLSEISLKCKDPVLALVCRT